MDLIERFFCSLTNLMNFDSLFRNCLDRARGDSRLRGPDLVSNAETHRLDRNNELAVCAIKLDTDSPLC